MELFKGFPFGAELLRLSGILGAFKQPCKTDRERIGKFFYILGADYFSDGHKNENDICKYLTPKGWEKLDLIETPILKRNKDLADNPKSRFIKDNKSCGNYLIAISEVFLSNREVDYKTSDFVYKCFYSSLLKGKSKKQTAQNILRYSGLKKYKKTSSDPRWSAALSGAYDGLTIEEITKNTGIGKNEMKGLRQANNKILKDNIDFTIQLIPKKLDELKNIAIRRLEKDEHIEILKEEMVDCLLPVQFLDSLDGRNAERTLVRRRKGQIPLSILKEALRVTLENYLEGFPVKILASKAEIDRHISEAINEAQKRDFVVVSKANSEHPEIWVKLETRTSTDFPEVSQSNAYKIGKLM